MGDQMWKEEQQRVTDVIGKINERIASLEEEAGEAKAEVVDIRRRFWEDVTVNLSEPDDRIETAASMRQQAETLSDREQRHKKAYEALKKLEKLKEQPYFGRVDFVEEGESVKESIYLGLSSFQEDPFSPFLIYDWRAPISSLYYDHDVGEASYETPMGSICGTIELKRQFAIRDGQIRLMFDTGVTIGDELLQRVLSRNTDLQMKSIVATIQKEQNQVIRDGQSRMMIVQGPAGSGKTSAALQRVAYLLYKHRETLRADQILLFSPSPLFNSYVSSVLPELGEENMQQTTFQEYLEHRLGGRFQLEDPFDPLELMLLGKADDVRMEGIRFKSSRAFLQVILAYRDWLLSEGMIFRPIVFRNETIVPAEEIRDKFYAYDASIRLLHRIELLRDWLLEKLKRFETQQLGKDWVDEEMQYLSKEEVHRAYQAFRRTRKRTETAFDDFAKERDIAAQHVVKKHLAPIQSEIQQIGFVNVTALYQQLFAQESLLKKLTDQRPAHWQAISQSTLERLDRGELPYEDATPYLFLQELVRGFETNPSIRHVLIDEVQDYSPFQLEYIKRLFPRASMTVLGDLNQAVFAHASAFDEEESLFALYGPEQSRMYRLTKSYRSTREIVEFTRRMIPGGEEIIPFERSGEKPFVAAVADYEELHERVASSITRLREEGYESIGIITKTAAEGEVAYAALSDRAEVKLITKQSHSYEKGALILPVYLAKGVEFDAVILYNGSAERYGQHSDRKLFYTACTRAMHALHIFSVGEPSPFVTQK